MMADEKAPLGTKDHDPAPSCPKCGGRRYWSDYFTDELTPICVSCRAPHIADALGLPQQKHFNPMFYWAFCFFGVSLAAALICFASNTIGFGWTFTALAVVFMAIGLLV